MPYASQISGTLKGTVGGDVVTSFFTSVTDVIGGKSPIAGLNVRDALMQLFPGRFIVEVPGGNDVGPNAAVTVTVPSTMPCPAGTKE